MWAGQVSSPVRLERTERKDGCKGRERRAGLPPVIYSTSEDLLVTLVSDPQQTTPRFCGSCTFRGRVIFIFDLDLIGVTEVEWKCDFKALIFFASDRATVAVVKHYVLPGKHKRGLKKTTQRGKCGGKRRRVAPLGSAFKTDQTRLKGP